MRALKSTAAPFTRTFSVQVLKRAQIRTKVASAFGQFGNFGMRLSRLGPSLIHSHDYHEQIYFMLKGSGIMTVGNENERVKEGDAIYVPTNTLHGFRNDSNEPCEIICVGANLFRSTLGIKE